MELGGITFEVKPHGDEQYRGPGVLLSSLTDRTVDLHAWLESDKARIISFTRENRIVQLARKGFRIDYRGQYLRGVGIWLDLETTLEEQWWHQDVDGEWAVAVFAHRTGTRFPTGCAALSAVTAVTRDLIAKQTLPSTICNKRRSRFEKLQDYAESADRAPWYFNRIISGEITDPHVYGDRHLSSCADCQAVQRSLFTLRSNVNQRLFDQGEILEQWWNEEDPVLAVLVDNSKENDNPIMHTRNPRDFKEPRDGTVMSRYLKEAIQT